MSEDPSVATRTPESTTPEPRFELRRLCLCEACNGLGKLYAGGVGTWPRCKACRGEGRTLQLVASCDTPESLGLALVTLAREGEFDECPIALLDREGEVGKKWLIKPYQASPRNVSDAGRVLRGARQ